LGKVISQGSGEVEKGAIKRYINALNDHNPLYEDEELAGQSRYGSTVAPPLFLLTFDRERRPQIDNDWARGAVNAGNEFEFIQPVRAGDVITFSRKLAAIKEKKGRFGRMLIVTHETSFINQRSEPVAIGRWTTIVHEGHGEEHL